MNARDIKDLLLFFWRGERRWMAVLVAALLAVPALVQIRRTDYGH